MNYFRAILKSNEVSDRVFDLTQIVISYLSSNYNAFLIRRKCLKELNKDLHEELKYINSIFDGNEKVY